MAEKKETSKRRVLTPEEVEMVTGGAIVRPSDSSALVTMDHSPGAPDTNRVIYGLSNRPGGSSGAGNPYVCNCGFSCKTEAEALAHTCTMGWKMWNNMK